jgi:hypothetical protein
VQSKDERTPLVAVYFDFNVVGNIDGKKLNQTLLSTLLKKRPHGKEFIKFFVFCGQNAIILQPRNILLLLLLLHCKKGYRYSCPQPGCHLKLSLPGMIKLFPARESLVCDIPAVDGKTGNLFLQCNQALPGREFG